MESIGYFAGLATSIIVVMLIVYAVKRFCRPNDKNVFQVSKYDERQKIAQGKAYRNGFWTLLLGGYVGVMAQATLELSVTLYEIMLFVAMAGLLVYVCSCIIMDAYMGMNDNPKRWMISMAIIAVSNLAIAGAGYLHDSRVWKINVGCGMMILVIVAVYSVHQWRRRNGMEDEE